MKRTARHNFDAKQVQKVMLDDLVNTLNIAAELVAGGAVGKKLVGISSQFKRPSPPASRPGQVPHVRTGTLKRSFRTKPAAKVGQRLVAAAGTNVSYAKALEYGNPSKGLEKRPYMQKGINSAIPEINKRIEGTGSRIKAKLGAVVRPI